jgi:hypothetical protein
MIAKRIIEAAKKGERDPVRLRNAGLFTDLRNREIGHIGWSPHH